MNWFRSHHTQWLETEYAALKQEIVELRIFYQKQLDSAITRTERLQDELARTRIALTPSLQSVHLPHEAEDDAPPPAPTVAMGTPWDRIKARMIQEEDQRAARHTAALKGVSNAPVESD
jgi:hypothetical protein